MNIKHDSSKLEKDRSIIVDNWNGRNMINKLETMMADSRMFKNNTNIIEYIPILLKNLGKEEIHDFYTVIEMLRAILYFFYKNKYTPEEIFSAFFLKQSAFQIYFFHYFFKDSDIQNLWERI